MKKTYYYICTLAVLLLMVALPAKAVSEAEFGKLAKSYTLHADGSQEWRVQKELTLFTHAAMNVCMVRVSSFTILLIKN